MKTLCVALVVVLLLAGWDYHANYLYKPVTVVLPTQFVDHVMTRAGHETPVFRDPMPGDSSISDGSGIKVLRVTKSSIVYRVTVVRP